MPPRLWGLPYMTSAVGGGRGSPRSRQKEQNQLIHDSDRGEGSKNQKMLRTSYMEAPFRCSPALKPHVTYSWECMVQETQWSSRITFEKLDGRSTVCRRRSFLLPFSLWILSSPLIDFFSSLLLCLSLAREIRRNRFLIAPEISS